MKGYEKYKKTNNIWFPIIPIKWYLSKVKYVANTYAGGTPSTENSEYWENGKIPWLPSGKLQNSEIITAEKFITEQGLINSSTKWIKANTTLVALTGATCGNVGYLKFKACANQSVIAIDEIPEKVVSRFLYYMFLNIRKQILTHQTGGAQAGINDNNVKNLFICIPSINEQTQIAAFLDKKTALIDEIIAKKERLIELSDAKRKSIINESVTKGLNPDVKMKESGIEFLGEIPEHWKIVRLKQIANAFGRIGFRGYTTNDLVEEGEGAITISPSNMKGNYMTFENCTYISWEKYEESPEIKIFNDDILMVKTGSTYGKIGLVKNLDRKATINPQILVLKDVKINNAYLFNLLRTNYMQYQVETNVIGSTIPTISQTKILNFHLPLPPNDEIEQIMFYIQNQMELIDKVIELEKKSIQKLKDYRQSLISEAVTGKIDVSDYSGKID
jgi:type I restriction enzyme S subunit